MLELRNVSKVVGGAMHIGDASLKLDNEKPQGETVDHDEPVKRWTTL